MDIPANNVAFNIFYEQRVILSHIAYLGVGMLGKCYHFIYLKSLIRALFSVPFEMVYSKDELSFPIAAVSLFNGLIWFHACFHVCRMVCLVMTIGLFYACISYSSSLYNTG